jgi:TBC1 domain family member 2
MAVRGKLRLPVMATARSPPARPHVGIHPSAHFESGEWGEDDAWDSASDSESPSRSNIAWSRASSSTATAPRPVPRPARNSSSSTLAFSYTHVTAPNPGSYPPRTNSVDPQPARQQPQNGWTIVRTSGEAGATLDDPGQPTDRSNTDADVEGDMILGEMEQESVLQDSSVSLAPPTARLDTEYIRKDANDIVRGTSCPALVVICSLMYHRSIARYQASHSALRITRAVSYSNARPYA